MEKAQPRYLRPARPISVSAVPCGPGIDIWRSCRFSGALMRSLCLLPGGLGRFVLCSIGANHCRLRHIGWEKCGHGLTSWPREKRLCAFLSLSLSCWVWSCFVLAGTLALPYCFEFFSWTQEEAWCPGLCGVHSFSGKDGCGLIPWVVLAHVSGLHVLKEVVCSGACTR